MPDLVVVRPDQVQLLRLDERSLLVLPCDEDGWVGSSLGLAFRQAGGDTLEVRLPDGAISRC